LSEHPAEKKRRPDRTSGISSRSAIEEILRYESSKPARQTAWTTERMELGGVTLEAGHAG